jgi:hypothetical protein
VDKAFWQRPAGQDRRALGAFVLKSRNFDLAADGGRATERPRMFKPAEPLNPRDRNHKVAERPDRRLGNGKAALSACVRLSAWPYLRTYNRASLRPRMSKP